MTPRGCRTFPARLEEVSYANEVIAVSANRWLAGSGVVVMLWLMPPCVPQAQPLSAQPRIERLVLADGESVDGWSVTEGTLEPSSVRARSGRSLLFHILVDWHGGEAAYPIGWPRCWFKVPEEARDWTRWERLRFWIYADTSRDELPDTPLSLLLTTVGPRSNWSRDLPLKKGRWIEFVFPLDDLPGADTVRELKFSISESRYRDKDIVDFYIDDLELIRYTQPTVTGLQALASVCFTDEPALPLMVELLGLAPGKTAPVNLSLRRHGKPVAQGKAQVPAGRNRVSMSLPAGLTPGEYTVHAEAGGQVLSAPVRLVDSPWQKGEAQ